MVGVPCPPRIVMTTSNDSADVALAVIGELPHGRGRGDGCWPHQRSHPISEFAQPDLDITDQPPWVLLQLTSDRCFACLRMAATLALSARRICALMVPRSSRECQGTLALCLRLVTSSSSSLRPRSQPRSTLADHAVVALSLVCCHSHLSLHLDGQLGRLGTERS